MKLLTKVLAAGIFLSLTMAGCDKDDEALNQTDRDFMVQAAYGNLAEVDAGQLASTKGQVDSVRIYGQMMVADHSKANSELDSLAKAKAVTLPTAPDAEHQALKQRLMTLAERNFDTAYIKSQVMDHQKTISLFENEVNSGKDADVKSFASKTLPHLRMHLAMAESINKKL